MPSSKPVIVRHLGSRDYMTVFQAMKAFTVNRDTATIDELWLVEHPRVFTQGLNGKPEHLLRTGDIPVVQVDRGGQVTYHGPGQVVVYLLIDLRRAQLSVRHLVTILEQCVIDLLAVYGIQSYARPDAPGVYVSEAKIASLGLRVQRGCCYHGLSLNVAMDVEPFRRINPCGYPGLQITQLSDLGISCGLREVKESLLWMLLKQLRYQVVREASDLPKQWSQEAGYV